MRWLLPPSPLLSFPHSYNSFIDLFPSFLLIYLFIHSYLFDRSICLPAPLYIYRQLHGEKIYIYIYPVSPINQSSSRNAAELFILIVYLLTGLEHQDAGLGGGGGGGGGG